MFDFETEELKDQFFALISLTTGEEPCYDPALANPEQDQTLFLGESPTDQFVENWTNQGVSEQQAAEMCAGCDVLEQCKAYAMNAREPYGIWGGTTPRMRGIPPKYKGN